MKHILFTALMAATVTGGIAAAPASAQDRWDWDGGRPGDSRAYDLDGPGVRMLYPELRSTSRGRAFVLRNFDLDRDGFITPREARAADRAFDQIAGADRRDFDWDRHGDRRGPGGPPPRVVEVPVAVPVPVGPERGDRGGWDRGAMRAYHFRDTPQGARMTLQEDVLFRTDSAELRPGAVDKLHALADYLQDNPGVHVAIDGFTDSRGSDAHNQDLSDRRADSVRAAFDQMGVTEARFRVRGHGETDPVATNATQEGMRLNRRVEVTLLGQRASSFE